MIGKDRRSVLPRTGPPSELDPDGILDAITQVASELDGQEFSVTVGSGRDPDIEIVEQERTLGTTLTRLTATLERVGVDPRPEFIKQAIIDWLDTRPVSDRAAERRGIATLGWSQNQAHVAWRVVVPRPSGVTPTWVPTIQTPPKHVLEVRELALARSRRLTVTALQTGDVTVWVYLVNPALSTAVLSQPDLLANGNPVEDLHTVFTPGRPVAVAPLIALRRLTEESTDPHKMLPLSDLKTIGWK